VNLEGVTLISRKFRRNSKKVKADINEYKVTGAVLALGGDVFSISDLARFAQVDEETVSQVCVSTLSSVLLKVKEGYVLVLDAEQSLEQKLKDMYPRLPRLPLVRMPEVPLALLLAESDLYGKFRKVPVPERDGILDLAAIHIATAANEIDELRLRANHLTRPLIAHLEYRLQCINAALKILTENQRHNKEIEAFINRTDITEADVDAMEEKMGEHLSTLARYCIRTGMSVAALLEEIQDTSTQPYLDSPTEDCLTQGETESLLKGEVLPEHRLEHVSQCDFCLGISATMPPER
jgi:hypothetical protein